MARGIPIASARGFRVRHPRRFREGLPGRTAPPTPLHRAPQSPRREPVGMTRSIIHDAVGLVPGMKPPDLMKRPDDDGTRHPHRFREGLPGRTAPPTPLRAHAPKAPGGSRLG